MDKDLLVAIICFSLGLASFTLAIISAVSQYYAICKTNNTSNSLVTYIIFWICTTVCLSWCFIFYLDAASDWKPGGSVDLWLAQWELIPLILSYMFDFILLTSIIIVKIHHLYLAKKLKMNELQLAAYLTKKKKSVYLQNKKKFWRHPYFAMIITFIIAFIVLFIFTLAFVILGSYPEYDVHFGPNIDIVIVILSVIGAAIWEAISWPQFIISLKTKNTSGISLGWAIFFPCACVVSFAYSLSLAFIRGNFAFDSIGGIVFSGMLVNFGILILKIINIQKAKKRGMTEIEYTQKVLVPMYAKKQAAKKTKKQKRA